MVKRVIFWVSKQKNPQKHIILVIIAQKGVINSHFCVIYEENHLILVVITVIFRQKGLFACYTEGKLPKSP
jgi:hypothetical protein